MNLNEQKISRFKKLAGILNEDTVNFTASGGRSEKGTLGYFVEEYLIELASKFVSKLDEEFKADDKTLVLIKEKSKIDKNNIFFNFKLKDSKYEFSVNLIVNLEDSARTKSIILYQSTKTEFDLNSKQSSADLNIFINNSVEAILNLIKIKG
jgi:hypothetical protein